VGYFLSVVAQPDGAHSGALLMSSLCPTCGKLVPIRVVRVEGFRYIYRPHWHDNGEGQGCAGKELR